MVWSRVLPFAVLALAACAGSSTIPSGSPQDVWRASLARVPLQGAGCFRASYPERAWSRVACSTALLAGLPRHRAMRPLVSASDYTAIAPGNLRVSTAVGSFPAATVTGERTVNVKGSNGTVGPNSYTLQINTNVFSTAACKGVPNCGYAWVQFVYTNPPNAPGSTPKKGQLNIWNWLEPSGSKAIQCPKSAGWKTSKPFCYQVSPTIDLDNQAVAGTSLQNIALTGTAGTTDSVYLSVGQTTYAIQQAQNDGITDLSANWTGTQFNIYGNDNGSVAQFDAGSSITVSLQTGFDTGVTTAPKCATAGTTTAESNSLAYVAAPKNAPKLQYPSILFTESNGGGGAASCKVVRGLTL